MIKCCQSAQFCCRMVNGDESETEQEKWRWASSASGRRWTQLVDTEGQLVYETLGWCLMHNQHGCALCDLNGNLCFEEVDEDQLTLVVWIMWTPMMCPTVPYLNLEWIAEPGGFWICFKYGASCFFGQMDDPAC